MLKLFVNAVSLVFLFFLLAFGMDRVVELTNFAALATYCILNVCVIVWCFIRKKERISPVRSFVFPLLGLVVTGAIFFSIEPSVALIGWIWIGLGILYYFIVTRVLKKKIDLISADELS